MKQCFLGESLLAQPPPQSAPLPSGGLLPPRPLPIKPGPEDVDVATEDKSDWKTILLTLTASVCLAKDTFQSGRQTRKRWKDIHQNHQSHQTAVPPIPHDLPMHSGLSKCHPPDLWVRPGRLPFKERVPKKKARKNVFFFSSHNPRFIDS